MIVIESGIQLGYTFRVVTKRALTPIDTICTVHPGYVMGTQCGFMEQGWTFKSKKE